jgi:hypothetical protein
VRPIFGHKLQQRVTVAHLGLRDGGFDGSVLAVCISLVAIDVFIVVGKIDLFVAGAAHLEARPFFLFVVVLLYRASFALALGGVRLGLVDLGAGVRSA